MDTDTPHDGELSGTWIDLLLDRHISTITFITKHEHQCTKTKQDIQVVAPTTGTEILTIVTSRSRMHDSLMTCRGVCCEYRF